MPRSLCNRGNVIHRFNVNKNKRFESNMSRFWWKTYLQIGFTASLMLFAQMVNDAGSRRIVFFKQASLNLIFDFDRKQNDWNRRSWLMEKAKRQKIGCRPSTVEAGNLQSVLVAVIIMNASSVAQEYLCDVQQRICTHDATRTAYRIRPKMTRQM